jgi:hypothetical protein
MKKENFKDFQSCAKLFNYNLIPFKRIYELRLTQNLFENSYRLSPDSNFIAINIRHYERSSRNSKDTRINDFPNPKIVNNKYKITAEKKKDLNSMMSWCPESDKYFLNSYLN